MLLTYISGPQRLQSVKLAMVGRLKVFLGTLKKPWGDWSALVTENIFILRSWCGVSLVKTKCQH